MEAPRFLESLHDLAGEPMITLADVDRVGAGRAADPAAASTLRAETYTEQRWYDFEQSAVFARSWQWVCHREKLAEAGDYITVTVAGHPVVVVRDRAGELRAFYNVCKHRAHEVAAGEGSARSLRCPYHGWTYDLDGSLLAARHTQDLVDFDPSGICLEAVQVEEFAGFVFVNLDLTAAALRLQSGDLGSEIAAKAPGIADLTLARRLTYDIASNWKNVVENYLECYHCHIAHRDFVSLVDMSTYRITTHGIHSSQTAEAGRSANSAYDVADATVRIHEAWWLWPNTCLMRYPGRGNVMVMHVIPAGADRTLETYDFYLADAEPNAAEAEAIRYVDEVLQVEDIGLVESTQRGMRTPAFTSGRLVCDPAGGGISEHGVHHFGGLLLEAYRAWAAGEQTGATDGGEAGSQFSGVSDQSALERGIDEGWIALPRRSGLEPITRSSSARSTTEVLDEDRG